MTEIEVIPIGGHSDFGRNMTAVRVGREIVLFDMGVKLDPLQTLPEGQGVDNTDLGTLREMGAVPDDRILKGVEGRVVAIVISHAHADHVAAVPVLAGRYPKAPILGSPYTIRYIEELCRSRKRGEGDRLTIPNRLVALKGKQRAWIGSGKLALELVHVTHSIPGSTIPVLHTPKGAVVYALDFKFDNTPVLGKRPEYERLAQIGHEGVHLLITESTNAAKDAKTDSEKVARLRLRDLMLGLDHDQAALFVTTFSSNAARIHSILDFAQRLDRVPLVLGRSLERYQGIAAELGHLDLPGSVRTFPSRHLAEQALRLVADEPTRYLTILTGHQGEPGAMLTRLAADQTIYKMGKRDDVIFSSTAIPSEATMAQRADLEARLKHKGVRLYKGAHASGHASGLDHREMLSLLRPEHIVPAHGGLALQNAYVELAAEEGYRPRKEIHVLANGQHFLVGKSPSPAPRHAVAPLPVDDE